MSWSDYVRSPLAFRQVQQAITDQYTLTSNRAISLGDLVQKKPPHASHPDFGHLTLLVFEAVLEVVCVSLPGYIVARQGLFDAEAQKFLANLNVMLFTPCLIFNKLASQLTAEKLGELAIIPAIFVVQTIISFVCALLISKILKFKKRQQNFVIAMGVFGNSNSLPISLVISLSKTLKGLHWEKIPGDNDDEVAARGILYLLIFQQLGQLVRWTWGYNVLLAPADKFDEEDGGTARSARLEQAGAHDDAEERQSLLSPPEGEGEGIASFVDGDVDDDDDASTRVGQPSSDGTKTPQAPYNNTSYASTSTSVAGRDEDHSTAATPANGNITPHYTLPADASQYKVHDEKAAGFKGAVNRLRNHVNGYWHCTRRGVFRASRKAFKKLPMPLQKGLALLWSGAVRFIAGVWEFMNPPLWAMLIAIVVASVPPLQRVFFHSGTFVRNSVTRAIQQSGSVAVPLILVVLGGNLARNTLPRQGAGEITDPKEERKLLIASLVSRMLLPTVLMAPLLAVTAKYVSISILEDKIFIIVCFLLTGAPTALQLAQICQINNVYMPVMSNILFQSYVIWILPSTLVLVLLALETVEWAQQ